MLLPPLHVECLFLETGLDGLGSSRIPIRQAVLEAAQGLHQKMAPSALVQLEQPSAGPELLRAWP